MNREQVLYVNSAEQSGCASAEPFALRVIGDSMEPEFQDGCIIIIDPASPAKHGSYVLAKVNEEYIFRQFVVEEESYSLRSLKDGYEEIALKNKNAIRGVIVQRAGTRRKEHKHYV